MTVTIEIFSVPGCTQCANAQGELRAVAAALIAEDNLIWRGVNVLDALDYAVTLGILSLPAVAINGELRFSSLPTPEQLRTVLLDLKPVDLELD